MGIPQIARYPVRAGCANRLLSGSLVIGRIIKSRTSVNTVNWSGRRTVTEPVAAWVGHRGMAAHYGNGHCLQRLAGRVLDAAAREKLVKQAAGKNGQRRAHAASVPIETRSAPVSAVDPGERGRTLESHDASHRAGA